MLTSSSLQAKQKCQRTLFQIYHRDEPKQTHHDTAYQRTPTQASGITLCPMLCGYFQPDFALETLSGTKTKVTDTLGGSFKLGVMYERHVAVNQVSCSSDRGDMAERSP